VIRTPGAAEQPPLAQVLERVATYLRQFEKDFAIVLSDEDYNQKDVVTSDPDRRSVTDRRIRSEMLFSWMPDERSWLTVRNVLAVDGALVPDSKDRLDVVLRDAGSDRVPRLRRLRDEGARFNLGRIYRNFNYPTLVLQWLDRQYQPHFRFSIVGAENVNNADTWKMTFAEDARPTRIRDDNGEEAPSSGTVWIGHDDGAVVRTSLTVTRRTANFRGDVVVDYHRDPKLGIWVPSRMVENYVLHAIANRGRPGAPARFGTMEERIECVATYSHFRQFETSARIVSDRDQR
jgi:hypothetical protein